VAPAQRALTDFGGGQNCSSGRAAFVRPSNWFPRRRAAGSLGTGRGQVIHCWRCKAERAVWGEARRTGGVSFAAELARSVARKGGCYDDGGNAFKSARLVCGRRPARGRGRAMRFETQPRSCRMWRGLHRRLFRGVSRPRDFAAAPSNTRTCPALTQLFVSLLACLLNYNGNVRPAYRKRITHAAVACSILMQYNTQPQLVERRAVLIESQRHLPIECSNQIRFILINFFFYLCRNVRRKT
jgi:hypothetical protein